MGFKSMKRPFYKSPFLISAVILCLPFLVSGQTNPVSTSNETLRDLQRYQEQFEDYESEFGPFDDRLLEPLASMINLQVEQANFAEVAELQSRQLSIYAHEFRIRKP